MVTKQKSKKIDEVDVVEKLAKKLLNLTGSKAEIKVTKDEKNDAVLVNILSADETGLLIGKQGETISSLQTILGIMVMKEVGQWIRIMVNAGDWIEKQEGRLNDLASEAAARAKETKEPQQLYNLNAAQRRVVHLFLSNDPEIETESSGEGRDRFLIVRLRK